jgi:hypothetical protein
MDDLHFDSKQNFLEKILLLTHKTSFLTFHYLVFHFGKISPIKRKGKGEHRKTIGIIAEWVELTILALGDCRGT